MPRMRFVAALLLLTSGLATGSLPVAADPGGAGADSSGSQPPPAVAAPSSPPAEAVQPVPPEAQASPQASAVEEPEPATPASTVDNASPAAANAHASPGTAPPAALRIAAPAGAFGAAMSMAITEPFRAERSVEVELLPPGEADEADVMQLDSAALTERCDGGTLERLDAARLAPASDGSPASADYLPDGIAPCGAATVAWSSVIAVSPAAFKRSPPQRLADVFDTKRYPGARALPRGPRYLMELALLADGVAPGEVYATLESDAGIDRALARLGALGSDVIWLDRPSQAIDLLMSGKAAIASAFSGRAFLEIARGADLSLIWDGQVLDVAYLAVRRQAPAATLATDFVAFATAPEQLARLARQLPYGPMRRSAIALADRHATTDIALAPFLPTTSANLASSLRFDGRWWAANEARVAARLDAWREGGRQAKAD